MKTHRCDICNDETLDGQRRLLVFDQLPYRHHDRDDKDTISKSICKIKIKCYEQMFNSSGRWDDPESSNNKHMDFDICNKCLLAKLIELLQ